MKTSINFNKLKGLPMAEQLKALASGIAYEMAKPQLALELAKNSVLASGGNVSGLDAKAPSFERIKSFLAMKYGTSSDTPELSAVANEFEQFFHTNMPAMDMAFTQLFDVVDLRNSTHDHFDILDTNAGISWTQREPGGKTQIRRAITEAKATVSVLEFSDGLGLLDRWLQFQQFWNIDEAIAEFRAKYYEKKAELHYGLFTALGAGVDTAFSTDDVTTANAAAATIIRNTKSSGYSVGDNPSFYAVCAPEKVGRLEKMLTAQRGSAMVDQGTVGEPLAHRIAGIIGTTHVPAADTGWYMVLPGRKIKRGDWKDLTVESARNAYVSAEDLVGVGQYNAAIGDSNQVRRVKYA